MVRKTCYNLVNFIGIPESPYKTYEQLCNKVAEVMVPICDGVSKDIRWKTSANIPIINCQQFGAYIKNRKREGRITFLFMKHKICFAKP